MKTARTIALYTLVLFTTGYAALSVLFLICPFDRHFDTATFTQYWQTVDGYMSKRMPVYGIAWLMVIFVNLVLFFKTKRQSPIFWMVLASLVILIADMVFTAKAQFPINQYFQSVNADSLTATQIRTLEEMREQSNENFRWRNLCGWIMFFMMSITPYLLPRLNQKINQGPFAPARAG